MARPKKGEEKHAAATLGVRVWADLRDGLDRLAAAHGRTLTDEVRHALEGYVRRELRRVKA